MLGSARIAFTSALSLAMISLGVFFGAPMPNSALASKPGTVAATVGVSGSCAAGSVEVTASARSEPDLMCWITDGMLSKITCTWPPIRSVSASAAPRYGTCCILAPVIDMNISPERCTEVPLPDEARFTLPGLAFT